MSTLVLKERNAETEEAYKLAEAFIQELINKKTIFDEKDSSTRKALMLSIVTSLEQAKKDAEKTEADKKAEQARKDAEKAEADKKSEQARKDAETAEADKKAEQARKDAEKAEADKKAEQARKDAETAEADKKAEQTRKDAEKAEATKKEQAANDFDVNPTGVLNGVVTQLFPTAVTTDTISKAAAQAYKAIVNKVVKTKINEYARSENRVDQIKALYMLQPFEEE